MYQLIFHTDILLLTEIQTRKVDKRGGVEEACYPSIQEVEAEWWLWVQGHSRNFTSSRSAWNTKQDPVWRTTKGKGGKEEAGEENINHKMRFQFCCLLKRTNGAWSGSVSGYLGYLPSPCPPLKVWNEKLGFCEVYDVAAFPLEGSTQFTVSGRYVKSISEQILCPSIISHRFPVWSFDKLSSSRVQLTRRN